MRLIIRDLVKKIGEDAVLNGAGYSFWPGVIYGLTGPDDSVKRVLLDCINFEVSYEGGYIELDCNGKNIMDPSMVGQILEEPSFPEFLTIAEFLKYFIDMNKRNIKELKSKEEYLNMVGLLENCETRLLKDLSFEERVKLQFLCFMIYSPSIVIVEGIRNIQNLRYLREIKGYLDKIKKSSIVIVITHDVATTEYLCDETVTIENGYLCGGY